MRATALPTASAAVTLRAAMASANSHALHCHSGLFASAIARSSRPHVAAPANWGYSPGGAALMIVKTRRPGNTLPQASRRCLVPTLLGGLALCPLPHLRIFHLVNRAQDH